MRMTPSTVLLTGAMLATALTACSGGKSSSSSTSTTTTQSSPASSPAASPAATTAASPGAMANAKTAGANGAAVFTANCSSCHQTNGKGQPGVFPPLAGNTLVTGDPKQVIHIVKNGLSGKVVVNGTTYNGQMPAWKGQLKDPEIAAVISYIRSSWGNKASAVTTAEVTSTP